MDKNELIDRLKEEMASKKALTSNNTFEVEEKNERTPINTGCTLFDEMFLFGRIREKQISKI